MKYKIKYKIKSLVLEISDINKLCALIENQAKQEQAIPTFELECRNKLSYTCSSATEYVSLLKENLNSFESISLSLLGQNTTINFSYFNKEIGIIIESSDRDIFLRIKEEMSRLIDKNDSWNRIPFTMLLVIVALVFILPLIISILLPVAQKFSFLKIIFDKIGSVYLSFLILISVLVFGGMPFLEKIYPHLIITDGLKSSGRLFKKDLWVIIGVIITAIIIPILLINFF